MIEIPPPPAEEPTDDEASSSSSDEAASEASEHETEPSEKQPSAGAAAAHSYVDMKPSQSLPDDELLADRENRSPIKDRQRSKSDPRVVGLARDSEEEVAPFLSPDDPLVQAVQREISEAFNVSNDDLNYFAEELLTELAYMDEEDGTLGDRMTSTSSVFTPSTWQETYQNLPEDYTVTDV